MDHKKRTTLFSVLTLHDSVSLVFTRTALQWHLAKPALGSLRSPLSMQEGGNWESKTYLHPCVVLQKGHQFTICTQHSPVNTSSLPHNTAQQTPHHSQTHTHTHTAQQTPHHSHTHTHIHTHTHRAQETPHHSHTHTHTPHHSYTHTQPSKRVITAKYMYRCTQTLVLYKCHIHDYWMNTFTNKTQTHPMKHTILITVKTPTSLQCQNSAQVTQVEAASSYCCQLTQNKGWWTPRVTRWNSIPNPKQPPEAEPSICLFLYTIALLSLEPRPLLSRRRELKLRKGICRDLRPVSSAVNQESLTSSRN